MKIFPAAGSIWKTRFIWMLTGVVVTLLAGLFAFPLLERVSDKYGIGNQKYIIQSKAQMLRDRASYSMALIRNTKPAKESGQYNINIEYKEEDKELWEGYIQTLVVAGYVQQRVNTPYYGYLQMQKETLPRSISEYLETGAGICGDQGMTFVTLMRELGYEARPVSVFWNSSAKVPGVNINGHYAAEVKYGGKWRFVDLTWGTFLRLPNAMPYDLLSFQEARQLQEKVLANAVQSNNLNTHFQVQQVYGLNVLEYLHSDLIGELLGEQGVIYPQKRIMAGGDDSKKISLEGLPQSLGVYDTFYKAKSNVVISFREKSLAGIRMHGTACSTGGNIVLESGQKILAKTWMPPTGKKCTKDYNLAVTLEKPLADMAEYRISFVPEQADGVTYIVTDSISLMQSPQVAMQ